MYLHISPSHCLVTDYWRFIDIGNYFSQKSSIDSAVDFVSYCLMLVLVLLFIFAHVFIVKIQTVIIQGLRHNFLQEHRKKRFKIN